MINELPEFNRNLRSFHSCNSLIKYLKPGLLQAVAFSDIDHFPYLQIRCIFAPFIHTSTITNEK
jgi:hypothetical protein